MDKTVPARIGRVKFKNGGAEIKVLNRQTFESNAGDNWRGRLVDHARKIASYAPKEELVGFYVIGIYSGGRVSAGVRWNKDRAPFSSRLLPAFVAENIREDLITDGAIEAYINRTD